MKRYRTVLYVGADSFYSQIVGITSSVTPDKAVVVVQKRNRSAGIICCASKKALDDGIELGMSVRQAHRKSPNAGFYSADFALYRDYFEKMLDVLANYSPQLEPNIPGTAYIDITGTQRLFGDARIVSEKIINDIYSAFGLKVRIGCASNKLIAFSAFHTGEAINIIQPADEQEKIKTFPVELLVRIYPEHFGSAGCAEKFQRLGVSRFAQLSNIPESLLRRQFGKNAFLLKRLSNGIDLTEIKCDYPKKNIKIEHMCNIATSELYELGSVLVDISDRAVSALMAMNLLAAEVSLKMFHGCQQISGYLKFKAPTNSRESILYALTKLIRDIFSPDMSVCKLEVKLMELHSSAPVQYSLFGGVEKDAAVAKALGAINTRFGERAIYRASAGGR